MAHDHHPHDDHGGLAQDLELMLRRRRGLLMLAGAAALSLLGCGGGGEGSTSTATTGSSTDGSSSSGGSNSGGTTTSCSVIPEETAGPYPGDGSNGVNVLALSGIVRSDIRSSFGGASGTAEGVPLTVKLQLVNTNGSCADLAGYAIYLWHCNRDGKYSLYSAGVTDQNYLRGVQATDGDGVATFTTIFPACYSGRWPHIHFEVYRSTTTATSFSNKLKTSQLALPEDVCRTVYNGASGYSASVTNLNQVTLATDNVFSDGATLETPTVTGSLADGYVATLAVGIGV
jgi:protocatechuate 3,4-dioxygenase beta subunit